jgi:lipoprotein-releasing system permease protein
MPPARFEKMVILRYLLPGRSEAFITLVAAFSLTAVMLGVAALIIVMSVMNGFRTELMEKISGLNGHAMIKAKSGELNNWRALAQLAMDTPGVVSATPTIDQALFASLDGRVQPVIARGMLPSDITSRSGLHGKEIVGSFRNIGAGTGRIALGARLAETIGATLGTKLTLIFPHLRDASEGGSFPAASYTVVAIFEVGVYDMDKKLVLMSLEDAQEFLKLGDKVESIEVSVSDPENVASTLAPLIDRIGRRGVVNDWRQMNRDLFGALAVDRIVSFAVICVILVVAAFNMCSSLIMLVRSKRRDIAIMMTMGATRFAIMRIFITIGTSIGLVGVFAGCLLSGAFIACREQVSTMIAFLASGGEPNAQIDFIAKLPARTSVVETASICLLALLFSFIATLYPAWRASLIDPAEVLRYE